MAEDHRKSVAHLLCMTAEKSGRALGMDPADVCDAFAGALAAFVISVAQNGQEKAALSLVVKLLEGHRDRADSLLDLRDAPASAAIN